MRYVISNELVPNNDGENVMGIDCDPELVSLIDKEPSIEELVAEWVGKGRSIELDSGINEINEVDALYIGFKKGGEQVGLAYVAIAEIKEAYPAIEPVSNAFISPKGDKEYWCVDDNWYSRFEERYQLEWNECICEELLPFDALIHLSISHGIAYGGSAKLQLIDDYFSDDELDDELRGKALWLNFNFLDPISRKGWGGTYCAKRCGAWDLLNLPLNHLAGGGEAG